jgi:hypothetical protein
MVRQIFIGKLHEEPDSSLLGRFPTEDDYDEVIDEDCDVYLPDGSLAVVFRKAAIQSLVGLTPDSPTYQYWRWASRSLMSDQRGAAAGKAIRTNPEIRITEGQRKFFALAIKKELTLEEALELTADSTPTTTTFFVGKTEEDGLVDLEEIEKWDGLVRKKNTAPELRAEAIAKRNAAKLVWFENWLRTVWALSPDKVKAAKEAKKRYITTQPRGNRAYSAVFGTIDRSGRTPFGRLTKPTMDKYEDFEKQKGFYHEVDSLLKEHMPDRWQVLHDRFKQVKDERYNLFGTSFTSLTINHNFQVAAHVDSRNAEGGIAVLTALDSGTFEGFDFIMHPLRLAFHLRTGDVFIGDNQSVPHSMTEMRNASADAESITYVFYSRDSIIKLDTLECETCRREFLDYAVKNHPELGTGEKKWAGSFSHMWCSSYWEDYKVLRTEQSKGTDLEYDYTSCSNTNINGNPDVGEVVIRQPHLAKEVAG